jgi:WD40 repeat protein/alpha/beta superfamily hydrolase
MKIKIFSYSWLNLISVAVVVFLVACGGLKPAPTSVTPTTTLLPSDTPNLGTSTMPPKNSLSQNLVETVTFPTTDGITLAGTLFGGGDTAIILAHQGTRGANQTNWGPFARLLAEHGYTALTFNFRGVGLSEGELSHKDVAIDMSAAVEFLHRQGYEKIFCAGASMGGTACIRVARDYAFTGLIILASAMRTGASDADSLDLSPVDLERLTTPKLFIFANHESSLVVDDTRHMYKLSPEPKALLSFPGTRHGTDLFSTDVGGELSATMLRFIENTDKLASETLPALQPITTENADKVQLLRTMAIPYHQRGRLSQCSLDFSPDGSLLIGACGKNQVPIWDVQNGFLLRALYDSPQQIVTCAFSPDGNQIACGGFDRTITLWDAITGRKIQSIEGHTAPIWELGFDPTGKSLASCSLGLLGDGTGRGDIRLWNMPNGEPIWSYARTRDYLSVSFDPSGKTIAYGSIGGSVGILDIANGELTRELTDSTRNIGDVTYSPSGRWLAAGSDDNRIYLWDASTFKLAGKLTGHAGYVNGVAFNPEEALLVSGSHDKTVGIWNLAERKLVNQLKGHESEVLRVAFSPDGTLIASISWDGTVRLWGIP